MRGTKTPEAIAMRRAMRSSDPKALSSATNNPASSELVTFQIYPMVNMCFYSTVGVQQMLHPPMTTNTNTLSNSPSPSPKLLNANAAASLSSVMLPPQNNNTTTSNASLHIPITDICSPQFVQHGHIVVPAVQDEPGLFLDQDTTFDRQHFIFYQDEGGLQAKDEENLPLTNDCDTARGGTIYYLGVIDILTPYGFAKRAEHFWRCCTLLAGNGRGGEGEGEEGRSYGERRKKISQVNPKEYGDRFVAFMKAIMRGGEGGAKFK